MTWRIPTKDKVLYLTFDDGPVPGPTEFVLETLEKAGAHGTFFCIGDNIVKHHSIFEKVVTAGHKMGNHTFNHLSGWKTGTPEYLENIRRCQEQLRTPMASSGIPPTVRNIAETERSPAPGHRPLFRPPYGRITRSQIRALNAYNIMMWDVLTHDYARSLSTDKCLKGALTAARPGSLVVFHDSFKAARNLTYVLPRFIDHFAGLGFSFKSLP